MKTLTLVCNFLMLGFICLGIVTNGMPHETVSLILVLATLAITLMNILLVAGSDLSTDRFKDTFPERGKIRKLSIYLVIKAGAVVLNVMILGFIYWYTHYKLSAASPTGFNIILAILIVTPTLSIVRISLARWNRFGGLKRTALLTGSILVVLIIGSFFTFRTMIGHHIRENISMAKKEYPGKAEDALLAYLSDSSGATPEKRDIAIWTLGQIRSRKALPVLKELYNKYHQYEIHKAIVSIETDWLGSKEKNMFGSWSRLNK